MPFLRRNQYLLCSLAVLLLSSVMVLRQFLANHSAHVEMREDFLLLHERAEKKPAEKLYQLLIQQLPDLSEQSLVEDWQRTRLLVDPGSPNLESLVWKYHVSVKNELQKRSEARLARALARAQQP